MSRTDDVKTTKGERTKAAILDAALELFMESGYDGTTMRAIARRAGVSVGNAYYYFPSKEHLIQGYYERSHVEHLAACEEGLGELTRFRDRLEHVLRKKIEVSDATHDFAGKLFQTAADPKSPLNPFSDESLPVRNGAVALMARVVEGADVRVPRDLAAELPELLWMYEMSIVLFWIHDPSEGRRRTYKLIERTAEIVARLVGLASNPLMRPLRKSTLKLLQELRV